MKKTIITYGLISGAISAVLMLITAKSSNSIGFDKSMIVGYAGMLLAFLVIYPGLIYYRNNFSDGTIKFGKALGIGMGIVAISALCYTITWMAVSHFMFPDFMEKYSAYMIETARKSGASPEQLHKKTEEMQQAIEMYKNPLFRFGMTLIEPLPVGIVLALASALVVRKKKNVRLV